MNNTGINDNLRSQLEMKVLSHKERFVNLFYGRYKEMLPHLIIYNNILDSSIDTIKLENSLRNNIPVIVGKASNGEIMILGYTNHNISSDYDVKVMKSPITKKDINFTVPKHLIPDVCKEITNHDNCQTGNFVVMKNKEISYISDDLILSHYVDELSEIVVSRYSLSMQSKINTFFIGSYKDESIEQLVVKLYNGSPFIPVNKFFNPKENIHTVDTSNIGYLFSELKREYQNKIAEMNNMLGINSLAVDKSSGVSDTEAKSNSSYTTSNANIYLSSRQNQLDKLNKRFGTDFSVSYNDVVQSELLDLSEKGVLPNEL